MITLREQSGLTAEVSATLTRIASDYTPVALASSLSAEDMVLTDLILCNQLPIEIFTLDTGRLHQETLDTIDKVRTVYGYEIKRYYPNAVAVNTYVKNNGLNGFYNNVELRHECCNIRKVEPLKHALAGKRAWITGQRHTQSSNRSNLAVQEFDKTHQLEKFNPLIEWSSADVWDYIHAHQVPYNALHDRGYPSIGCEPCTRAIKPGENPRAGRWWWEHEKTKECGLHVEQATISDVKSSGEPA